MGDGFGMIGLALIVAAIGGCIVGTNYVQAEKEKAMTPQQMCVQRAWTQADRVECLKNGVALDRSDAK